MDQKIFRNDISEKLWCGTFSKIEQDILNHAIKIDVRVIDSGITKNYLVTFQFICNFRLEVEEPENDWDYVELTEIQVIQKDNFYECNCDLWSIAKLYIKCREIHVIEH